MSSDMLNSHLSAMAKEVSSLVKQVTNKDTTSKKTKKTKQISKIDNAKKIITKNKKTLDEAVALMSVKKSKSMASRNDKLRVIKTQRNYKSQTTFK